MAKSKSVKKATARKAAPPKAKAKPPVKAKAKIAVKAKVKPVKKPLPVSKVHKNNHAKPVVKSVIVKSVMVKSAPVKLTPFLQKQKEHLLQLRDSMLDSMSGVARDNLRTRSEGSEASAFGMHQADAGSDAYDRDFALSLLSQEQDALYEIDEALKRIELGTYGKCEMSGKPISRARLEAIPFARFTVECQSQLEKQSKASRVRQSVTSLFGLTDEEAREGEEEEATPEAKE